MGKGVCMPSGLLARLHAQSRKCAWSVQGGVHTFAHVHAQKDSCPLTVVRVARQLKPGRSTSSHRVGPRQPGREDIVSTMRSFAADHSHCAPYNLEDSSAWSGLEWAIDLRELLTAEDHMAAARIFILRRLDDVSQMRKQYPDLPSGSETSG